MSYKLSELLCLNMEITYYLVKYALIHMEVQWKTETKQLNVPPGFLASSSL